MIIFRPHRGSFEDSIREAQVFDSVEDMKKAIVERWKKMFSEPPFTVVPFTEDDIVINFSEPGSFDDRCGWEDTRYVCLKRIFDENYMELYGKPQVMGMCATKFPDKE